MTSKIVSGLSTTATILLPAAAVMVLALATGEAAMGQESVSLTYGKMEAAKSGRGTRKLSTGNTQRAARKSGSLILYNQMHSQGRNLKLRRR